MIVDAEGLNNKFASSFTDTRNDLVVDNLPSGCIIIKEEDFLFQVNLIDTTGCQRGYLKKFAPVFPIPKNSTDNYSPKSLLAILRKLFEKSIINKFIVPTVGTYFSKDHLRVFFRMVVEQHLRFLLITTIS